MPLPRQPRFALHLRQRSVVQRLSTVPQLAVLIGGVIASGGSASAQQAGAPPPTPPASGGGSGAHGAAVLTQQHAQLGALVGPSAALKVPSGINATVWG